MLSQFGVFLADGKTIQLGGQAFIQYPNPRLGLGIFHRGWPPGDGGVDPADGQQVEHGLVLLDFDNLDRRVMVFQELDRFGAHLRCDFLACYQVGGCINRGVVLEDQYSQTATVVGVGEVDDLAAFVGHVDGRGRHIEPVGDQAGNQPFETDVDPFNFLAHLFAQGFDQFDVEACALTVLDKFHWRECGIGADSHHLIRRLDRHADHGEQGKYRSDRA
ncbi:hypothetical protein D3C86_1414600 [compost metagenome]